MSSQQEHHVQGPLIGGGSVVEQQPHRKFGQHSRETTASKTQKKSVDLVVEAFLDEHPAFLDDYVRRKVSRKVLERWLFLPFHKGEESAVIRSVPAAADKTVGLQHCFISDSNLLKTGGLLSCVRGQPEAQRQRSRSFTPLRKLSATTFEDGGLATPILAKTSDGHPSFLRTSAHLDEGIGTEHPVTHEHITNRKDLLLALLPGLMQVNDVPTFAKMLMKSANLLMGQSAQADFVILSSPNAFDGTTYSMTSNGMISKHTGVISHPLMTSALTSSQLLNVDHFKDDQTEFKNALLGPLCKMEGGETLGGLQLSEKPTPFTPEDANLFGKLLDFASIGLTHLLTQLETRLELARSEVFLELARTVFSEPTRLESTMLTILTNFLSIIDCERCQVSLSDRHQPLVFKRVFDLHRSDLVKKDLNAPYEDRLPLRSDLIGLVAKSGQNINLHGQELGQDDLRSFLCLPIKDPEGVVVGVISLANKDVQRDCLQFTKNDERFVEAFSVFCAMAIRNAVDYEKAVLSEAKMQVAFEVMNYQAAAKSVDATQLAALPVPASSSINIDCFNFSYLNMDDNATLTATIRIFTDLGLISRFGIDYESLCRWLLTVKRNYRNETVQYHNWYHAFNVTQMMFCILLETNWNQSFPMTEILGLIIACISHDLDHRGTNNSFQQKMNNPLAKLYSTSTLERHHLNQCLLLLTLRGNNILDNLKKDEYADTLAVIERSILATDLALHFRDAPALSKLSFEAQDDTTESFLQKPQKRELLQAGLMTAADLGNATKPWDVHRHVSQLIAEEFWHQGDIERRELNIEPQPMLDRNCALHEVQIQFLDNPCLTLYEDMSRFSSALKPLLEGCLANRQLWSANDQSKNPDSREHARNL